MGNSPHPLEPLPLYIRHHNVLKFWSTTSCSSGLGRELAIAAAQNNNTVVATSHDVPKLISFRSVSSPKSLDIRGSDAEIKAVVDDVEASIGPVDILVNNEGYDLEGR